MPLTKRIDYDFDGVIYNAVPLMYSNFYKLCKEKQVKYDKNLIPKLFMGDSWDEFTKAGFSDKDALRQKEIIRESMKKCNCLCPGVKDIILETHTAISTNIVSSNEEGLIIPVLLQNNIDFCFQEVIGKESMDNKSEYFERYTADEILFITDTVGDIKQAALHKHVKTVAVPWGVHDIPTLSAYQPEYIVRTVDELRQVIEDFII